MISKIKWWSLPEPVVVSADLFGKLQTKVSFGGSPTELTVEDVVSQRTKIYGDTTWSGLGSTQLSDALISATVTIPTGLGMTRYAMGSLEFSGFSESKWAADVELVFKHNAIGIAEYDKFIAGTTQFIRLETTGSEIEDVTPVYDKLFRLDLALHYTEPPTLFDDENGENVVALTGKTFHDPTSDRQLLAFVRNKQTALA